MSKKYLSENDCAEKAQTEYEPKVYMCENGEIITQYVPHWIKQIKVYCDFLNITPVQLVQQHMDLTSPAKNKTI